MRIYYKQAKKIIFYLKILNASKFIIINLSILIFWEFEVILKNILIFLVYVSNYVYLRI